MPHQWDESARDDDLVKACLEGDEAAWTLLIRRYRRLIYTIPLRFGLPTPVAEEIFQDVCLTLLEKLHTVRDRTRLSAWIVTVTRRACIQHWRRSSELAGVEPMFDYPDEPEQVEERLLDLERRHTLQQALERLDRRCQKLIKALFLTDPPLSYQTIAQDMNMPEGSIGPTRARCLDKLRKIVADIEGR